MSNTVAAEKSTQPLSRPAFRVHPPRRAYVAAMDALPPEAEAIRRRVRLYRRRQSQREQMAVATDGGAFGAPTRAAPVAEGSSPAHAPNWPGASVLEPERPGSGAAAVHGPVRAEYDDAGGSAPHTEEIDLIALAEAGNGADKGGSASEWGTRHRGPSTADASPVGTSPAANSSATGTPSVPASPVRGYRPVRSPAGRNAATTPGSQAAQSRSPASPFVRARRQPQGPSSWWSPQERRRLARAAHTPKSERNGQPPRRTPQRDARGSESGRRAQSGRNGHFAARRGLAAEMAAAAPESVGFGNARELAAQWAAEGAPDGVSGQRVAHVFASALAGFHADADSARAQLQSANEVIQSLRSQLQAQVCVRVYVCVCACMSVCMCVWCHTRTYD